MKQSLWTAPLAVVVALGGAGGCNVASRIPNEPPQNPAKESKCGTTSIQARPLIVEWPSSDRAALEARIKQGLVPVRYVGCDMEVLTTCMVPAKYAYAGITPKNDKVVIHNSDELYANIPVHAAKFEGRLQKAGSLEVAMTIIGRYESNRHTVRADELQGECAAATHVISALTVGAFRFSAGATADVSAGVGIGSIGASGTSSASNETLNTDGDSKVCEKATGDDKAPPFGCGALLRVELVPLGEARKEAAPAAAAQGKPAPSGACGGSTGCELSQKACDGGDLRACVTVGEMFYNARGVTKDGARAAALFKQACDKGEPGGCVDLGWAYLSGTGVDKNASVGASAFAMACNATTSLGCLGLGTLYVNGTGVGKDKARAAALFKQACDAGISAACKMP